MTSYDLLLKSVWYTIRLEQQSTNWFLFGSTQIHMYITYLKQTLRSIYFIVLAWRTILILQNKTFHEFVLTILHQSLFNTLMDMWYSAFVSKFFISNDSLILLLYMLDNFASVFGCSQLNRLRQSLECLVAPNASHFPAMLSSWCSVD